MTRWLVFCVLLAVSVGVLAIDPEQIEDPVLQERYKRITEELRCLVCQNQTIGDSNAELAVDLRRQVRAMLEEGASDDDIRAYMTSRYGDFVLYKPPLNAQSVALWFGPAVLLLIGFVVMAKVVRQHLGTAEEDA